MSLLDTIKKMLGTADTKLKPIIEYYDNGKLKYAYSVDEDGNKQGSYKRYWNNGQLAIKFTYKDGKKDGPYENYHENGQLYAKCTYKDGKLDGPYEEYHDNGQLFIKCTHKDGELDGAYEEYLENGQLSIKCTYKDGELDGSYEEYSYGKNGNLCEKVTYRYIPVSETKETPGGGRCDVNGNMLENVGVFKPELRIKEGPFEEYHANGQLYRRGINKNGKEEGPYEIYSPDGVLVEKGIYIEGLPLTEKGEIRETVQVPPYRQTPSPEPSTKAAVIRMILAGEARRRRSHDY